MINGGTSTSKHTKHSLPYASKVTTVSSSLTFSSSLAFNSSSSPCPSPFLPCPLLPPSSFLYHRPLTLPPSALFLLSLLHVLHPAQARSVLLPTHQHTGLFFLLTFEVNKIKYTLGKYLPAFVLFACLERTSGGLQRCDWLIDVMETSGCQADGGIRRTSWVGSQTPKAAHRTASHLPVPGVPPPSGLTPSSPSAAATLPPIHPSFSSLIHPLPAASIHQPLLGR